MLAHNLCSASIGSRGASGGEITKAARNWIGENLDAAAGSKIMFIDRNDILNLYIVTNLPMPVLDNDIEL